MHINKFNLEAHFAVLPDIYKQIGGYLA
jgi:hypothetical protein